MRGLSVSVNVCPVEGKQAPHMSNKSNVTKTVQSLELLFVLRSYRFCVQEERVKDIVLCLVSG